VVGCSAKHWHGTFRVLAAQPDYLLRYPDLKQTPFTELLGKFTSVGDGWVDLKPEMDIRVENAYYREGAPRHGLENYLGTEVVRYRVRPPGGLRQVALEASLEQKPSDQPPVQLLLAPDKLRFHFHRYFYQVVFKRRDQPKVAILLSAGSKQELEKVAAKLLDDAESICHTGSQNCTMFPETCTVALEMRVMVNGVWRTITWGSTVAGISDQPQSLELFREFAGRLTQVEIDLHDPQALRLPLLPGDRLTWK
jgi:hypothetical protein